MKVGDYVRTPQGIIAKIINIQEDTGQYFLNGNAVSLESKNYIADKNITIGENFKHSPNIIDLIEVGDYVNGYKVLEIEKDYLFDYTEEINVLIVQNDEVYEVAKKIYSDDIKSIVTKEQFENMEYRIGE